MTTLKPGDPAPSFEAKDQNGNLIKLSDYRGKKLVLFFYPKANTPGCTAEACDLRDHYEHFLSKGYDILGVSADNAQKQQNFRNKFEFPYPLLADENKAVINAYEVWGPKKFMGKSFEGIHRVTFIINEEGNIENVITKVKTKEHTKQILG